MGVVLEGFPYGSLDLAQSLRIGGGGVVEWLGEALDHEAMGLL